MSGSSARAGGWEQVLWQRRAAVKLMAILAAHPDLQPLIWTVSDAGADLIGHLAADGGPVGARGVFDAWSRVLGLHETREYRSHAGVVHMSASGRIDRVSLRLTATVTDDGPEG
jgi:hypothetical protein